MAQQNHSYVYDSLGQLKDAGLIAASAAATVSSVAKILDLGASSYIEGVVVIDVTAIEVATGNERYEIEWQLSSVSDFSTAALVFNAATLNLGDSSVNGSGADSGIGRYTLFVSNEFAGTVYRYARLYTRVAGTIATGINYSAFLSAA